MIRASSCARPPSSRGNSSESGLNSKVTGPLADWSRSRPQPAPDLHESEVAGQQRMGTPAAPCQPPSTRSGGCRRERCPRPLASCIRRSGWRRTSTRRQPADRRCLRGALQVLSVLRAFEPRPDRIHGVVLRVSQARESFCWIGPAIRRNLESTQRSSTKVVLPSTGKCDGRTPPRTST